MSKQLGTSLRAGRDRLGMTQADIARSLGVSKAAVGQWERGETEPSTLNLIRVCDLLKIDVAAATGGVVRIVPSRSDVEVPENDAVLTVEDRRPDDEISDKVSYGGQPGDYLEIVQIAPIPRGFTISDENGRNIDVNIILWEEVIDYCPRPSGIRESEDVFCFYMPNDRHSPRYRFGELVFVKRQEKIRIGDYALIRLESHQVEDLECKYAAFGIIVKNTYDEIAVEETNPSNSYVTSKKESVALFRVLLTHELFGK